jgi:putative cell wall-binding protein
VIVGGEGTISRAVENELRGRVSAVERIAGENRYATNLALLDRFLAEFPADGRLWVATGRGFPDALAAGPVVAATAGRLLLVDGGDPAGSPGSVAWFAQALKNQVVLVGGYSAISGAVEQRLQEGASTAS